LGPKIQGLRKAEEDTKKRFENLNDDIFKKPWEDAIRAKNLYYLLIFLLFALLPFFYMLGFVYSSKDATAISLQFNYFDILLLKMTAGFEGFVLFVYTIFSQKSWYFYTVPLFFFLVFRNVKWGRNRWSIFNNYLECVLLLIWTFLYFSKTSILWSIPFFLFLSFLFMT